MTRKTKGTARIETGVRNLDALFVDGLPKGSATVICDRPSLAVVKTRGSAHDLGTYYYSIAKGGGRIGERLDQPLDPSTKKRGRTQKRTKKTKKRGGRG